MTHPIVEGLTEAITMAKLMRENEELRADVTAWNDACNISANDLLVAKAKLAEEKALADQLHFALTNNEHADINAVFAAYRKARGIL